MILVAVCTLYLLEYQFLLYKYLAFQMLTKYLAKPLLISLQAASSSHLGLYQSSFAWSNVQPICNTCPISGKRLRRGRYIFPTQIKEEVKQEKPKFKLKEAEQKFEKLSANYLKMIQQLPKKNYFRLFGWLLTIFSTSLAGYFQAFKNNGLSALFDKIVKQRNENIEVSKGKKVEDIIHEKELRDFKYSQKKLRLFQSPYASKEKLQNLLQIDDAKLLVYIQTVIGSSVGTNLKRLAWERTERDKDLKDQQNYDKLFKKLYYVNLKQPAIYSVSKDQDSGWGIAKDLNYLLTSIIGNSFHKQHTKGYIQRIEDFLLSQQQKQKRNRKKKSVLIIEQAQLLQTFLKDKASKEKLQELYQKIYYVQRKRGVRVFFVGSNNSFFHRFNRQLESPNLQDCKYEFIGGMPDDDIRRIIQTRSQITDFYGQNKLLETKFKGYYDSIVNYIVDTNDNVREVMRIIKEGRIDFKEIIYEKHLASDAINFIKKSEAQLLKQWEMLCRDAIRKEFQRIYFTEDKSGKGHYQKLKTIKNRIFSCSEDFIQQKRRSILDQVDQSSQKINPRASKISSDDIIKSKMAILMLIFSKKFADQAAADQFLFSMNKSQVIAYEELNNAQIIHGLNFSSKAYERAFYYVLMDHKDRFSRAGSVSYSEYKKQLKEHGQRIQKHNQQMKELEEKLDREYIKNA